MNSLSPDQNEELRRALLEILAVRHPVALPPRAIRRRIQIEKLIDFPYDEEALTSALEFLRGLEFVLFTHDELGSSQAWAATSKGVLQWERKKNG